jgi:SAM-dependent methyltransferase
MTTLGVRKIIAFNWPWYVLALVGNVCAVLLLLGVSLTAELRLLGAVAVGIGNTWLVASLLVSHWVYDRSPLARGAWLDTLDPSAQELAILHAGHDEASQFVHQRYPEAKISVYDFFDPQENTEASLQRARSTAASSGPAGAAAASSHRPIAVRGDRLPLADGALDIAFVVFAAHEIRNPEKLGLFFAELHRVLKPRGVVVVVEHLRDVCNALAYGPGAWHFLARSRWLHAFSVANLPVASETRYTPFVTCFCLARSA